MNVCVQVNIDNEASKSGIHPDELLKYSSLVEDQSHLNLKGMMVLPKTTSAQTEHENEMKKWLALHANLKLAHPNAKT